MNVSGQHDLPMSDGRAHFLCDMQRGQQRPLLVAGGTRAALLAGEGDEHFVFAVGAANARKPLLQIAALQEGGHRLLDDRPPESVLGLVAFVVDLLEGVKMLIEQTPQVGGPRIAWGHSQSPRTVVDLISQNHAKRRLCVSPGSRPCPNPIFFTWTSKVSVSSI